MSHIMAVARSGNAGWRQKRPPEGNSYFRDSTLVIGPSGIEWGKLNRMCHVSLPLSHKVLASYRHLPLDPAREVTQIGMQLQS